MAVFKALNPDVEVNGQTVLSVVNGLAVKELAVKTLAANGILDPKPDEWYSQQKWLDAFKIIAEKIGPLALNNIGRKIPESADWPPQVNSIESALASIDIAYHMNHRLRGEPLFNPSTNKLGEGIGHYGFEKVSEKEVKMVCDNPYPCDFDKGIIYAAAYKFKPANVINIVIKEVSTGECRSHGAKACAYIIKW